ncbi:MAG: hypothetical protein KGI80_04705 [Verrucomicrobiota bacterium]|nr:hypothetical protein [Verrucomicrobiota bacterium]
MNTITLQSQRLHFRLSSATTTLKEKREALIQRLKTSPLLTEEEKERIVEADDPEETIAYLLHSLIDPLIARKEEAESIWEIKDELELLLGELLAPTNTSVESYLKQFAEDALACEMLYEERAVIGEERLRGQTLLLTNVESMTTQATGVEEAATTLRDRALRIQSLLVEVQRLEKIAKQDADTTQSLIRRVREQLP